MTSDLFRRYIDIVTEADQQSQYHPLVTDIDSLGLTFQPTTKKDLTYSPVKVALNQKNLDQMPALSFGTSADSFVLQTVTDDGHETTKPVTQGDVIVSGPGKEKYNIGNQAKFDKNYPIDAGKGRRKPDINSVRQVAQYTGQKPISIIASWGEQMNVLPGDYIVYEGPGKYYRVAKYLYDQTYNAIGSKTRSVAEGTKSLADYIAQSERAHNQPVTGDYFEINIKEDTLFETWVCDEIEDGIVIYADDAGMQLLESHGYLDPGLHESQQLDEILPVLGAVAGRALAGSMGLGNLGKTAAGIAGRAAGAALSNTDDDKVAEGDHAHNQDIAVRDAGEYDQEGDMAKDDLATIVRAARRLTGMLDDDENMPEWVQAKINKAADYVDTAADYIESNKERELKGVAEGSGFIDQIASAGHKIIANKKTANGSYTVIQNKNDGKYEIHKLIPGGMGANEFEFKSVHKTPQEMETALKALTGVAEGSYYPGEHGPEGVAIVDKTRQRGKPGGTYWAGSEGPDGVAIDDPNDVMPDKKPMVKKLGPKARAKTQMVKMYGDGEITFRKTSNGGYFIQHEDDFGDTHSHQYDPKTGEVDFSGVTRSTYSGKGVAEGSDDGYDDGIPKSLTDPPSITPGMKVFPRGMEEPYGTVVKVVDGNTVVVRTTIGDTLMDIREIHRAVAEGFNSDLEMELHQLTESSDMYDAIYNALGRNDKLGSHLQDMMYDVARENRLHPDDDIESIIDIMANRLESDYGDPDISEAKYQGREVPLGKPMKGDVKKSKVYVRGPNGNVVKVNFGQKGMRIKKNIPGRRKNFRARHNCDNPGPRWKARFWSCRAW